jgi:hypothetical protein
MSSEFGSSTCKSSKLLKKLSCKIINLFRFFLLALYTAMNLWHVEFILTYKKERRYSQLICSVWLPPEYFESEERLKKEIDFMFGRYMDIIKVSMCLYDVPDKEPIPQWYLDCNGKLYFR